MTPRDAAAETFDAECRACPRLAAFLDTVRAAHPDYHAAPVPPFGDASARLLVVGLAPGMHGANRTGRPFTGDYAGLLLYATLHRHGFANQARGDAVDDGLQLIDCRISNAVKCLPPDNKPVGAEVRTCNRFLATELAAPGAPRVLLALGKVAHEAVLQALGLRASAYRFSHGADQVLPDGRRLIASYHCSRYNTNTRRLTPEMFDTVVAAARAAVDALTAVPA
ncbi:MAG: uracil-DNA glycosylase [Pseudomonadota bacterium]|nr:uracil-DNA glycosylase [Pseudomonadota bacterium]